MGASSKKVICALNRCQHTDLVLEDAICTVPLAEILSGKNARAWVSMVLYLKK